ncbi:MFS Git1p-related glycerophosphoinositol and glycerophosphocholine permease, partial [Pisolithus tinctorius]
LGIALFSNGYNIAVIGAVITLLSREYPDSQFGLQHYSNVLTSTVFAGIVLIMIFFAFISDGSLRVDVLLCMVAVSFSVTIASTTSGCLVGSWEGLSVGYFVVMLGCTCFLLGMGVGAGHTCGSVFASERTLGQHGITESAQHWWLVAGTKTVINAGFVLSGFVPLVLYWIFGEQHLQLVCGLSLGFGAIPAFVVSRKIMAPLYHMPCLLWHMPKSYFRLLESVHILKWLTMKWYWKSVLGLSLACFIYDFIMYVHFAIYSSMIINNFTGGSSSLSVVLGWSVVINMFCIPGTVLGTFLIDYLGMKTTMIVGLLLQAIIGLSLGTINTPVTNHISTFAVVYGIFLALGEIGPGSCLHVLPAKIGPTAHISGHIYSIAATIGKLGAFIGTWVFPQIIDAFGGSKTERGNTGPFWIGSGLAILSVIVTIFLIKPLTPDSLKAEDKAFHQYLEENGLNVSNMVIGRPAEEVIYNEMDVWQLHNNEIT